MDTRSDKTDDGDEDILTSCEEAEDDEDGSEKYCVCESGSFGQMVQCDNDICPREWFHYQCVGLKKDPPGNWYCPDCRDKEAKGYSTPKPRVNLVEQLADYNEEMEELNMSS